MRQILFTALVTLSIAASASAAPIFIQQPALTGAAGSDLDFGDIVFDNFLLAAADTVTSVNWSGAYAFDNTAPAADAFTVVFYEEAGGVPGAVLQAFVIGNAVGRTASGDQVLGFTLYNYSASLGAGIALNAGQSYWLALFNDTIADANDDWFWASGDGGTFYDTIGPRIGTLSFSLENTASAPEPVSLLLLSCGLLGVGARRWSRRLRISADSRSDSRR